MDMEVGGGGVSRLLAVSTCYDAFDNSLPYLWSDLPLPQVCGHPSFLQGLDAGVYWARLDQRYDLASGDNRRR